MLQRTACRVVVATARRVARSVWSAILRVDTSIMYIYSSHTPDSVAPLMQHLAWEAVVATQQVLVVQDDSLLTEAQCLMLTDEALNAVACIEEEAVATAREAQPHLILLEVGRWVTNGLEISRQLAASRSSC